MTVSSGLRRVRDLLGRYWVKALISIWNFVSPKSLKQELRLNYNIDEDMYQLFAVVVHVGSGPNHGHYICLVRSHDRWLNFDDDDVRLLEDGQLQHFFGSTSDVTPTNEHGYMLFYMRRFEETLQLWHISLFLLFF